MGNYFQETLKTIQAAKFLSSKSKYIGGHPDPSNWRNKVHIQKTPRKWV